MSSSITDISRLEQTRFSLILIFNLIFKVSHRVVFPLELRLFNTSDDAVNPDRMYDLVAVVIHCGSGPNRSVIRHQDLWFGTVQKLHNPHRGRGEVIEILHKITRGKGSIISMAIFSIYKDNFATVFKQS